MPLNKETKPNHNWDNERCHIFPNSSYQKVNVIARLEFELHLLQSRRQSIYPLYHKDISIIAKFEKKNVSVLL